MVGSTKVSKSRYLLTWRQGQEDPPYVGARLLSDMCGTSLNIKFCSRCREIIKPRVTEYSLSSAHAVASVLCSLEYVCVKEHSSQNNKKWLSLRRKWREINLKDHLPEKKKKEKRKARTFCHPEKKCCVQRQHEFYICVLYCIYLFISIKYTYLMKLQIIEVLYNSCNKDPLSPQITEHYL